MDLQTPSSYEEVVINFDNFNDQLSVNGYEPFPIREWLFRAKNKKHIESTIESFRKLLNKWSLKQAGYYNYVKKY